jgi:hypothetical protein
MNLREALVLAPTLRCGRLADAPNSSVLIVGKNIFRTMRHGIRWDENALPLVRLPGHWGQRTVWFENTSVAFADFARRQGSVAHIDDVALTPRPALRSPSSAMSRTGP